MAETNLVRIFTDRLEQLRMRYMITGGIASVIYGEPRLTHDVDIVLEMERGKESGIVDAFPADEFYCAPIEIIRVEASRSHRGHFNIIHHDTGFKADIYLKGTDQLHEWALSERRKLKIEGEPIWVAPPEYVILRKLEYYREGGGDKHIRDIEGMIELSRDTIRLDQLNEMIERYGLVKEWKEVKKILPLR
jgi:hypothetical protein